MNNFKRYAITLTVSFFGFATHASAYNQIKETYYTPSAVALVSSQVESSNQAKEAREAAREAEKDAQEAAREAEKDAQEAAREAEREARKATREAEREARKAEREAKKQARKAERGKFK